VAEPAQWGVRRRVLDLLHVLNLARPAVRLYELALALRSAVDGDRRVVVADDLPLPPARLRAQAGPRHADARFFLRSGERHADLIRSLLAEAGTSIEQLDAVLDWGCGCGRVLRHWSDLRQTSVLGCDINPEMVAWCAQHLPFAEVAVNELSPPLPYDDASFDLVYGFSVLTHLTEELQHVWTRDCRRVLRPGGHFVFSTLGSYYLGLARLNEAERREFERGNVVVLYDGAPGTSLCSAYHPPEYVRGTLAADFELVSFRPAADEGRHDVHVFRKPA
jgi:SAM-dependent methyltransferase